MGMKKPVLSTGFFKKLIFLLTAAAVFGLLAAGGEAFVCIRFGRDVIGIVSNVGDEGLDVFGIRTVCQVGYSGLMLLYIDVDLLDTFFMTHVIFDPFLAGFALYGGRLDHDSFDCLLLRESQRSKADQQKG
jgi:hypothetical protein